MKCPYCNTELDNDALFCDICGQSVAGAAKNTDATNKYWAEVDALNATNEKEHQEAVRKAKLESKARFASAIKIFIVVAIVIAVLIIIVSAMKANSQQKLDFVKSDSIGNTYSDTNESLGTFNGQSRDRIIVTIKDEKTLSYVRGSYTLMVYTKGDGYTSEWLENEIYESRDYEYTFSTSLFGKITLEFNGKSYEVDLDDDGTIDSIDFYGH